MRTKHEWFGPEKLAGILYAYEAIVLAVVLGVVGAVASVGALAEAPPLVLGVLGGGTLLVTAYVTWWIRAFARAAQYRLTDEEVEYRGGVFFKQETTVPYDRITNVGTSQGPVERLLGAGSVAVHTAGFGGQMGAELTIGGVSDFEGIKAAVLDEVRTRRPAATESDASSPNRGVTGAGEFESDGEVLGELRRIRELLEGGRTG
jgi:uncharacterized membrane protein YdbT with pleckstrin-like domain